MHCPMRAWAFPGQCAQQLLEEGDDFPLSAASATALACVRVDSVGRKDWHDEGQTRCRTCAGGRGVFACVPARGRRSCRPSKQCGASRSPEPAVHPKRPCRQNPTLQVKAFPERRTLCLRLSGRSHSSNSRQIALTPFAFTSQRSVQQTVLNVCEALGPLGVPNVDAAHSGRLRRQNPLMTVLENKTMLGRYAQTGRCSKVKVGSWFWVQGVLASN